MSKIATVPGDPISPEVNSGDHNTKKILLSGVKPTGRPHIGNYFGAMRQFTELQDKFEAYVFIADLHAITTVQDKEALSTAIIDVALDYLAIGLDPKKVTLFKQSDILEHVELGWIFNCITTMPYLMRAHAFKDAEAKNKEINVGVFDYPMLMAADILLYDADVVPVGQDQKQHVEIARDTAEKFNKIFDIKDSGTSANDRSKTILAFKPTFKLPEPYIMKDVAVVPGTDGQKMSKSYGNTIPLFATDDEIRKAVMSIVTDSGSGIPQNVYKMHKLFYPSEPDLVLLDKIYAEKAGKYKDLKEALIADIQKFIRPLRERREKLTKDRQLVLEILKMGGQKAKLKAEAKMKVVREKIGTKLY